MCPEMHDSARGAAPIAARACTIGHGRNLHGLQGLRSCFPLDPPIALDGDVPDAARVVDGKNCQSVPVLLVRNLPPGRQHVDDHHSFGRFPGLARTLAVGTAFALTGSTARWRRTRRQREGKAS